MHISTGSNEMKTKRAQRINETQNQFFENKIIKINKPLAKLSEIEKMIPS